MGKGALGCGERMLSADGEVSLLSLRERFSACLASRLEGLLRRVLLVDEPAGRRLLEDTLQAYRLGDGGDGKWMQDFVADFRLGLASVLVSDDDLAGAVGLLDDDSVAVERAVSALEALLDAGVSPEDRSRVRHALAAVCFRDHQGEQACVWLEEDLGDLEVSEPRRLLASRKLEALRDAERPEGWQQRLVPPDVREALFLNGARFAALQRVGVAGNDGQVAVEEIVPALSSAGYHGEALQLADRAFKVWRSDGRRGVDAVRIYADAFCAAGRFDQAAQFTSAAVEVFPEHTDVLMQQLESVYDRAGLEGPALETARDRCRQASLEVVDDAVLAYASRLCLRGRVDQAFRVVALFDDRLQDFSVGEMQARVVERVLPECAGREQRSVLRNRLAGEFFSAGDGHSALRWLGLELEDPGLSAAARELTEHKISEVESYLSAAG